MISLFRFTLGALLLGLSTLATSATYVIDTQGQHAFVQFKISHLGYSWLLGRFDRFEGTFDYDPANPGASKVDVTIDTSSVNSNHAERDKHLRSEDFLFVEKYPGARFVSTRVEAVNADEARIVGNLTLRGVTREIVIDAHRIGGGEDPWGGYRQGFEGRTSFRLKDFGIPKYLGPASETVELYLSLEGVRK
ncbi:YceI family protein [Hahella sp. SMD15-11]|uniref:YceI family protein n=1 Tax=Thermohahella caldifontis TaxID=3142973 RepID=A0AB39V078_9GAMM